ncbi:MAG TPA: esterase-like activity of phytase family protein [Actinoplanes sp.]|nr:esterase-like activity of phytase family protein [Actinoplanes sp.]
MLSTPRLAALSAAVSAGVVCSAVIAGSAQAAAAGSVQAAAGRSCPPSASAVGYSDGLDKLVVGGATIGGLSSIAWDARSGTWASTVDNHGTDPARIWFYRDALHPAVTGDPLVLRRPDGTAYDGTTADDEGLAVLPDGDYLVSSETEPSIRIFGRDGVQKSALPVPARFAVAPAGEATANATLEGLTLAPSGKRIIAAMEGALSGDGDPTLHRFLVYDQDRHGHWKLTRQVAYRTAAGLRVPEVAAYGRDSLLVMEAGFDTTNGNTVHLYAVRGLDRAPDVTGIVDLSDAPALVVPKTLVADLVDCPTLGAPSREPQANPLLDNYEGMAVTPGRRTDTITLVSDDNFNPLQFTRLLTLAARLP